MRLDMTLNDLADTFDMLGDWEERYRYLIELGRKLEPMPEADKAEINKVRGCMSQVWLTAENRPGPPSRLHFRGDSDAHIVKGLVAVLMMLYSDRTPRQILDTDLHEAFARLGLDNNLTMNRRNGFYAMIERIRAIAADAERQAPSAVS
jgi:cysteine desulfuration protein SufE